ncbi:hypothetical protein [Leisingera sp. ANG-Vp]|uniref:hypothetical protein n=1 Tax=Leisingera sp. ANG-Vp TaxID=1577896 RepID=UPI00057DD0D1|nr:hypothetical protein [Leisingera sp. ANG-Vp]KIC15802.1 hypothetical protein RA20_17975 [Leisingera sp. ANG-Vp]
MKCKQAKPLKGKLPHDHELAEVIAEAYHVFACEKPSDPGVCDCCMDQRIREHFFEPEIAEMPLHYLQDWYFAAIGDEFNQHTWRYLLPRILEVLASGETLAGVGIEVSLNRFPTGVEGNWRDEEWQVLDRFQRLFLRRAVLSYPECLDDVLCMLGIADWPLAGLFEQVLNCPSGDLAERFWKDWCQFPAPGVWVGSFWERSQEPEVYAFYRSYELYQKIADLASKDQTPPELAEKALAVAAVIEGEASWT